MAPLPKFNSGDRVFAKVRGYSPWPAKIVKPLNKNNKYQVLFYGTGQTALVKPSDVVDFIKYKEKYGNKKSRSFSEALIEITFELTLEQNSAFNASEESKFPTPPDTCTRWDLKPGPSDTTTPVHVPPANENNGNEDKPDHLSD